MGDTVAELAQMGSSISLMQANVEAIVEQMDGLSERALGEVFAGALQAHPTCLATFAPADGNALVAANLAVKAFENILAARRENERA